MPRAAREWVPEHGFEAFHREDLPARIERNAGLAADDLVGAKPIAFCRTGGGAYTYRPTPGGVEVDAGVDAEACAVVELSEPDFSDFVNEIHTASGLAMAGKLHFERGGLEDLQRWEPALRACFEGRPIWSKDALPELIDEAGQTLDLERSFSPEDSDEEMRRYLVAAGFLHVRGAIDRDTIDELGSEVDRVAHSLEPGTGSVWWSTRESGDQVPTRINYLDRDSERIKAMCFDERVQRYGRLLDRSLRVCDDRLDGPMVFIKHSNIAQGLGDLVWHQDDGLGGHPVMCPLMQVGVQLDRANAKNGQLWVLAGSHRYSKHQMAWGDEEGQPVVRIETEPGDVTVHFGDLYHTTPAPTGANAGRRVLYFKFAEPKTFDAIPVGAHYNDLLFNSGADGRVATRGDTWREGDDMESFQSQRFEDRDASD